MHRHRSTHVVTPSRGVVSSKDYPRRTLEDCTVVDSISFVLTAYAVKLYRLSVRIKPDLTERGARPVLVASHT